MFTTLLESRASRARRTRSTAVSLFLHSSAIAMAVAITSATPSDAREEPMEKTIIFELHRSESEPQLHRPIVEAISRRVPDFPIVKLPTVVPIDLTLIDVTGPAIPNDRTIIGPGVSSNPFVGELTTGVPTGEGIVDEKLVDRAPRIAGEARPPQYPLSLRQNGIAGQVVVQFVVDTLGRAEMDGVQILEASHGLFADAVRSALAHYHFTAGQTAGRKVRTRVQLPFTFSLR